MMPLNLKSTRHLLTAPHMQAKCTEEPLVLQERRSHRPRQPPLGPASGRLLGEHVRLDCSGVCPVLKLNLGVPGKRNDFPSEMLNGGARGRQTAGALYQQSPDWKDQTESEDEP